MAYGTIVEAVPYARRNEKYPVITVIVLTTFKISGSLTFFLQLSRIKKYDERSASESTNPCHMLWLTFLLDLFYVQCYKLLRSSIGCPVCYRWRY